MAPSLNRTTTSTSSTQQYAQDRLLDALTTHVVAMSGFVFFYLFCRGHIVNRAALDRMVKHDDCFIIAMNHVSYLDWIVVWAIFRYRYGRNITFLAKDKLFKHPVWGRIMRHVQCVRVSDNGKSILDGKERLATGIIGIFPEGRRSRDGQLGALRSGAVVMARKYGIPILPVGLNGFYEAWQPGAQLPSRHPMHIVVGRPITVDDLKQSLADLKDGLLAATSSSLSVAGLQHAYIDVDHTLTDSTIADLLFYVKRKTLPRWQYRWWKLRIALITPLLLVLDKCYRPLVQFYVYSLYAKVAPATLRSLSMQYYDEQLSRQYYPQTLSLVGNLKRNGAAVHLVTSNLSIVLEPMRLDLGVILHAVDLQHLRSLGVRDGLRYLQHFKKDTLAGLPSSHSLGIGDSVYDRPIFDHASMAILKYRGRKNSSLTTVVQQVI